MTLPWPVRIFLALVVLAAVGSCAWLIADHGLPPASQYGLAALLGACMLLAWLFPLPVGFKTHFYLDTAVVIAAALLFEPGAAMLVAGVGTLAAQRLRRRFWDEAFFNTGQTMLQVLAAAWLLRLSGYQPGEIHLDRPGFVVAVVAAGIVLFLLSAVMVGTIVALQGWVNPLGVWVETIFKADDPVYYGHLAQIGLGIVIAALGESHFWTIALLIPPVMVVYLALDHGIELRRQAEMALRLQEKSLTEAQRLAHVGSWEWDLESGAQGWSEEAFRLLGFEPPFPPPGLEILLDRVHPDDREQLDRRIHAAIRYQSHFDLEHRVIQPNGKELVVHHRGEVIQDHDAAKLRVVAMLHDVSERRSLEAKLEHMAYHDPLTELPNRLLLFQEIESALDQSRRGGREFALLFVDLDGFKQVNDRLGHKAGDEVLVEVARRLASSLRQDDIVARYGGDEFVILARSVKHVGEVERLATRLLASLTEQIILSDGEKTEATATIGIVTPDSRLRSSGELLQRVDAALYQAKRQGKNRYAVYNTSAE